MRFSSSRMHRDNGQTGKSLIEGANKPRAAPSSRAHDHPDATLGLTPAALSHGIGAQTATAARHCVIGGALILAIIPRLLQPPLLFSCHGR